MVRDKLAADISAASYSISEMNPQEVDAKRLAQEKSRLEEENSKLMAENAEIKTKLAAVEEQVRANIPLITSEI